MQVQYDLFRRVCLIETIYEFEFNFLGLIYVFVLSSIDSKRVDKSPIFYDGYRTLNSDQIPFELHPMPESSKSKLDKTVKYQLLHLTNKLK